MEMNVQHAVRTAAFAIPVLCASLLSNHTPSGVTLTRQSIPKLMLTMPAPRLIAEQDPSQVLTEQIDTTFEHLEKIKHVFSLKISEMSEIFHASRPTIYAWLSGSSPKDNTHIRRLSYITQVAQRFASLSFTKPEAILKRPVLTGNRTLLQCLIDNIEVSDEELRILHRIDQKEAAKRAEPKLAHKRHNDVESMITPIINNLA